MSKEAEAFLDTHLSEPSPRPNTGANEPISDADAFLNQMDEKDPGFLKTILSKYEQYAQAPIRAGLMEAVKGHPSDIIPSAVSAFKGETEAPSGKEIALEAGIPDIPFSQGLPKNSPLSDTLKFIGDPGYAGTAGLGVDMAADATNVAVPFLGKIIDGGKAMSEGLGNFLENFSNKKAFKSLGPKQSSVMSGHNVFITPDRQKEIGQMLLDENIITNKPKGWSGLAEEVSKRKVETGEKIGSMIDTLSEFEDKVKLGPNENLKLPSLSGAEIKEGHAGVSRDAITNHVLGKLESELTPGRHDFNKKLEEIVSYVHSFEQSNPDFIPLRNAERLKRSYQNEKLYKIPYEQLNMEQKFSLHLADALRTGVEDAADFLASHAGSPVNRSEFVKQKELYGKLTQAERIVHMRENAEEMNRLLGPSTYGMGTTGAILGAMQPGGAEEKAIATAVGGIAVGGANALARKYGNQIMAKQASNMAPLFNAPIESFGKLAPMVSAVRAAAKTSPATLDISIRALLENPDFHKKMSSINPDSGVNVDPSDIESIGKQIRLKVKEPVLRAKMLNQLHREGTLINGEALLGK